MITKYLAKALSMSQTCVLYCHNRSILTVYRIGSLYGRTLHAELAFGVWLLNLLSFS